VAPTDGKQDQEAKDPGVRVVDRRWWARGENVEADESGSRKPTYVEDLEQRLADTTAQLQRVMTEHRRSLDEFEQVKGRLRRDVTREVERGKRTLLAELLEVLDNLDRAIESAAADGAGDNFRRGIELVRDQFLRKLDTLGVVRVPAIGELFDASRHEAVSTAPVDDPSKDGFVIGVLRQGYAIGDDLLRPASVVVGKSAS
jgi:molecular chaperone GrpE